MANVGVRSVSSNNSLVTGESRSQTIENFRLEEDDILYPDHLQAIVDKTPPPEGLRLDESGESVKKEEAESPKLEWPDESPAQSAHPKLEEEE